MIAWTLENTWLPKPMRKGWGNGYVAIPKSHPLYGLSIEELSDISLGLSVTLSEPIKYWEEKEIPKKVQEQVGFDWWVLGFDTGHLWNTTEHDKNWVKKETVRFLSVLKDMQENIN